jgi:hypothetical protein
LVSRFYGSGFTCCSRVWSLGFRVYAARTDDDKTHLHRKGVVAKHKECWLWRHDLMLLKRRKLQTTIVGAVWRVTRELRMFLSQVSLATKGRKIMQVCLLTD